MNTQIGFWQEDDGSWSIRRLSATLCLVVSIVLAFMAFGYVADGWIVFIPAALFLVAFIILLFFTTWSGIVEAIKAIKEVMEKGDAGASASPAPGAGNPQ